MLASHACNLHNRVGSTLPDGAYKLVPQVEVKQEVPQQEEAAPDQQLTVEQVSAQAQGKPRCMNPILKYDTRTYVYYTCALSSRCCLKP
jgi:hypothetical protein